MCRILVLEFGIQSGKPGASLTWMLTLSSVSLHFIKNKQNCFCHFSEDIFLMIRMKLLQLQLQVCLFPAIKLFQIRLRNSALPLLPCVTKKKNWLTCDCGIDHSYYKNGSILHLRRGMNGNYCQTTETSLTSCTCFHRHSRSLSPFKQDCQTGCVQDHVIIQLHPVNYRVIPFLTNTVLD